MFAAKDSLLTRPSGGYQISRSLRFNIADSTNLSRTPGSSGNQKTWTWSGWLKRSELTNGQQAVFSIGAYPTNLFEIRFDSGEVLTVDNRPNSTSANLFLATSAVFRDASAWYHIVFALDTTQATASNRAKLYVNGQQVTAFSTATYPSQNDDLNMNTAVDTRIGNRADNNVDFGGYQTECYFINGQALTPSSFGETNADTGVWQPKAFSGTYGTNGFYLNFSDNSNTTAATLGKDYSGNGNNWTPNNFSVTAGAGNDSLVDSPTSYGTDTGVGGTVRGNYCTYNPLVVSYVPPTYSNGNLDLTAATGWNDAVGTIGVTSGKWYWEAVCGNSDSFIGICGSNAALSDLNPQNSTGTISYYIFNGDKRIDGTATSYGAAATTETIGVALDIDGGTVTFYKNNTSQGSISLSLSTLNGKTIFPFFVKYLSTMTVNFGQRPFAYTAPSGFKALCTQNLPTPTIGATSATLAGKYFNPVLYTGNGATNTVTGVGFQPDFVWAKGRSGATSHALYDAVRGVQKRLVSNNTGDQVTDTTGLSAFGSDGFTAGTLAEINTSAATYVAWNWKANGAGSTNTSGTITSTVSASTASGFSVVTYTGTGGNATIGHGLGVAPQLIFVKGRDTSTADWFVYTSTQAATKYLILNTTAAVGTDTTAWNSTAPTSTVFSVGGAYSTSWSAKTYVAYCFAPISGYSAFGSYTGNGSTDGPFVYTGFRPAYVVMKRTSASGDWYEANNKSSPYNAVDQYIALNAASTEGTFTLVDFLSNGFKLRNTSAEMNGSGSTMIFMAFAENPFKYSLAR